MLVNDTEYYFRQIQMEYEAGQSFCTSMQSNLLEPRLPSMFEEVLDIAEKLNLTEVWIGVTDTQLEGV